jgi:hypothetical protein
MENTKKSFWSQVGDVACFGLYLTVGTGVVVTEAVTEIAAPAIKAAAIYTAKEGEEFINKTVIPAYHDGMARGKEVASKLQTPAVAAVATK